MLDLLKVQPAGKDKKFLQCAVSEISNLVCDKKIKITLDELNELMNYFTESNEDSQEIRKIILTLIGAINIHIADKDSSINRFFEILTKLVFSSLIFERKKNEMIDQVSRYLHNNLTELQKNTFQKYCADGQKISPPDLSEKDHEVNYFCLRPINNLIEYSYSVLKNFNDVIIDRLNNKNMYKVEKDNLTRWLEKYCQFYDLHTHIWDCGIDFNSNCTENDKFIEIVNQNIRFNLNDKDENQNKKQVSKMIKKIKMIMKMKSEFIKCILQKSIDNKRESILNEIQLKLKKTTSELQNQVNQTLIQEINATRLRKHDLPPKGTQKTLSLNELIEIEKLTPFNSIPGFHQYIIRNFKGNYLGLLHEKTPRPTYTYFNTLSAPEEDILASQELFLTDMKLALPGLTIIDTLLDDVLLKLNKLQKNNEKNNDVSDATSVTSSNANLIDDTGGSTVTFSSLKKSVLVLLGVDSEPDVQKSKKD